MERPLSRGIFAFVLAALAIAITSCSTVSSNRSGNVSTNVLASSNPLIGYWRLDGPVPHAFAAAELYALRFQVDGHVQVTFVGGYGFAVMTLTDKQIQHASRFNTTTATYRSVGRDRIRIAFRTDAVTYRVAIKGDKLFLTETVPPSGDAAADAEIAAGIKPVVFVRATPVSPQPMHT